jgi:hypothetical protein
VPYRARVEVQAVLQLLLAVRDRDEQQDLAAVTRHDRAQLVARLDDLCRGHRCAASSPIEISGSDHISAKRSTAEAVSM